MCSRNLAGATCPRPSDPLPQESQLAGLIEMINGDLTKLDRKKLITLCTIDVHARDVVQRLIDERVDSATAFQWQSQLRYVVSEKTKASQVRRAMRACLGNPAGAQHRQGR